MARQRKILFDLFKRLIRKGKFSKSTSPSPSPSPSLSSSRVNMKAASSRISIDQADQPVQESVVPEQPVQDSKDSVAPEQPIDSLVEALAKIDLNDFTEFSEFPAEIRQMIFKHSLPDGLRFLPLDINLIAADEEIGLYFTFALSPVQRPGPPDCSHIHSDIALLSVCKESRKIYIENNKSILPAGFNQVIRYDPDNTIVMIQNYADLQFDLTIAEGIRKGFRKQKWFSEIKRLAVPGSALLQDSEPMVWGENGQAALMSTFEKLERCMGIISPGDMPEGDRNTILTYIAIIVDTLRGELQHHQTHNNPDYKVPSIQLFEAIIDDEDDDDVSIDEVADE